MKSGGLSIVAGVYLLTLGYMMDGIEWTLAGGLLLIFGAVLMTVELLSDSDARVLDEEEKRVLAEYRGKQVYDAFSKQSKMFAMLPKKPISGEHPPGPIPEPRAKFDRHPYPGSARHHDPTVGSDDDVK